MARVFNCVFGLVKITSTLGALPFIDKFGRRPFLIVGTTGMIAAHLVLGLVIILSAPELLAVVLICVFVVLFEISLGPVVWITAERS